MIVLTLVKALVLLLPLGWFVLAGPSALKMFFLGGILALIELVQANSLRLLRRAWPIPLMVGLYLIGGLIAPKINAESEVYGISAAVATICYGVPAGFCFALWNKRAPRAVLAAYAIFAMAMTMAANMLIRTVGPENIVRYNESGMVRGVDLDPTFTFLGIFKPDNIVIGIVPMTIFALAALPLLLLTGWNAHKMLIIIASIAAVYANILVATRSTLLAAALSFAILFALLFVKGKIKRPRLFFVLVVCAGLCAIFANGLTSDPISNRLSEISHDLRFEIWTQAVTLLWNNPFGGGINGLTSSQWAHNLFLDFGLRNGWFGMISMLVLYGFIFYSIFKKMQRANVLTQPVSIIFMSVFFANFFIAFTEPPNGALLAFSYMIYCYCLAIDDATAGRSLNRTPAVSNPSNSRRAGTKSAINPVAAHKQYQIRRNAT